MSVKNLLKSKGPRVKSWGPKAIIFSEVLNVLLTFTLGDLCFKKMSTNESAI